MVPFYSMAELKQLTLILIQKRAHQIVEHAHHQTSHFVMSQNDHHFGRRHQFRLCFISPSLFF